MKVYSSGLYTDYNLRCLAVKANELEFITLVHLEVDSGPYEINGPGVTWLDLIWETVCYYQAQKANKKIENLRNGFPN